MSKSINLLSLVQAKSTLSEVAFANYKKHYHLDFRTGEIDDLASLIGNLTNRKCSISNLDNFVVGYKIPQIGKEFDLLRFGNKVLVNIELKRTGDEEDIKTQLVRNRYYLSFAGLSTCHYTYLAESGSLLKLSDSGEIEKTEFTELITLLSEQICLENQNFDNFFDPARYLVSPFNSTERFLDGEYFLTPQQEDVSNKVYDHLIKHSESGFISITGGAGTGKSLLAYHIAKTAAEAGKKVLIIHCGILNQGHTKLISGGWHIYPIRDYKEINVSDYDLVVIDEAQRLYELQFKHLTQEINSSNALCIFSFDKLQTLAALEEKLDIQSQVSTLNPISSYVLSKKIRSNKEIADFINRLFDKTKNYETRGGENIHLKYFSSNKDAANYLNDLNEKKWKLLKFTPSRINTEYHEEYFRRDVPTSHRIIGQEFDNVVVVIDELFSYHGSGQLVYKGATYYHTRNMLFQNITRARKKLLVVIINNEELLERCITILE